MKKKDYELIAGVINEYNKIVYNAFKGNRKRMLANAEDLLALMTTALENENPKFNRQKFLQAAGINHLLAARSEQDDRAERKERLEELRQSLLSETMSYAELAELQSLAEYIDPGDTMLLEAAGTPENQKTCTVCDKPISVGDVHPDCAKAF